MPLDLDDPGAHGPPRPAWSTLRSAALMTPTIAGAAYFDRCRSSPKRSAIAFAKGLSFGASGYLAFRRSSSSFSSTLRQRLNLKLNIRARSRPSGLC